MGAQDNKNLFYRGLAMVSLGAIHDFVVSHHPKNTAGAIHSAGLAGNNLGNSRLQVSGGWQPGHAPAGSEGRDEKEHGSQIPKLLSCMLCLQTGPAGKGLFHAQEQNCGVSPG